MAARLDRIAALARRTVFVAAALAGAPASAATFVVTSAADTGGASCGAPCTLRQAITAANATTAPDTIQFAIAVPVRGAITIAPATPLPTITQPVAIDGYTQSGTAPNTHPDASNARLRIRIDGAAAGAQGSGLAVCAGSTTIRGLSITRFGLAGVSIGSDAAGALCDAEDAVVAGNFIGLTPSGTAAGNGGAGVSDRGAPGTRIGGDALADRNVISANAGQGIAIANAAVGRRIDGNLVGTDPTGTLDRGNSNDGISLGINVAGVAIGELAPNRIAYNFAGIRAIANAGAGSTFGPNAIGPNDGLGLELGATGVLANDPDDADAGANALQNHPVLVAAARTGSGFELGGTLDVAPGAVRIVALTVHASAACDGSGHGEGERLLGRYVRLLQSPGEESFTLSDVADPPLPPGTVLTATATVDGSTSEFSSCIALDPPPLVVTSSDDPGDGTCDASCTLRDALLAANALAPGAVATIGFAIPGDAPHTIRPTSPLPTILRTVLLDGYSEDGSSPNTLADGGDAVIGIRLDGGLGTSEQRGLAVCGAGTTIRGLSITGFTRPGVSIGEQADGSPCAVSPGGVVVAGNFVGLAPDGSAAGNTGGGIVVRGSPEARIGGPAPADRNVVGATIAGRGIVVRDAAPGRRIDNNYVGVAPPGDAPRPNSGGISIEQNASGIEVGELAANLVASNNGAGVSVAGGSLSIRLAANVYRDNGGLAIDLGAGGVLANDADDADLGANSGQNHPVLVRAERAPGGIRIDGLLDVEAGAVAIERRITVHANDACDPLGHGEGERLLGSALVTLTDASAESFSFTLPTGDPLPDPTMVTATATSGIGNTSEFSACLEVTDAPGTADEVFLDGFED